MTRGPCAALLLHGETLSFSIPRQFRWRTKGRIRPWRGLDASRKSVRGHVCGKGSAFSPEDPNRRIHTQYLRGGNTKTKSAVRIRPPLTAFIIREPASIPAQIMRRATPQVSAAAAYLGPSRTRLRRESECVRSRKANSPFRCEGRAYVVRLPLIA